MTTRPRLAKILSVSLIAATVGSRPAHARGDADSPAVPVPQYSPDEAPGVSLWPMTPVVSCCDRPVWPRVPLAPS